MKRNTLLIVSNNHHLSKQLIAWAFAFLLQFTFTLSARAGSTNKQVQSVPHPAIGISNFGKVDDHYYRGAQPEGKDYSQLAAIGVKTIIDLRDDPKKYAQTLAEQAGLRYINLPMSDTRYPQADTASRFLSIISNSENWPVYVHCAGGRHRTGAMTAVYRITIDGWDVDHAYQEMKQYDFYTRWGHGALKDYVYDYYQELKQKQSQPSPPPSEAPIKKMELK